MTTTNLLGYCLQLHPEWPMVGMWNYSGNWDWISYASRYLGCGLSWNWSRAPGRSQKSPRDTTQVSSIWSLHGPGISPQVFGYSETGPPFHFSVTTSRGEHSLQLSFWVCIILWHDQYVSCAAIADHSPPLFRFVNRPVFVKSLRNNTQVSAIFANYQ
jgi:hypothetical protein